MGKIRIISIGEEKEEELRDRQKLRREEKKKREKAKKVRAPGLKGGERIKTVDAQTEEELEKLVEITKKAEETGKEEIKEEKKKKTKKKVKVSSRSKRYKQALTQIDSFKQYPINEAIELLRQTSLTSFDPTVELHINTTETGLRGNTLLPHGRGKKIIIKIADGNSIEKIVKAVETGKIDFDVLVAEPSVMSRLATVAKILGPRGLMPNPKSGTISDEPEKVADKLQKGSVSWKTEVKSPIVHQAIGKLSFKDEQLIDNFNALVDSINSKNIKKITLKSTMSPGIKVAVS